MNKHAWISHPTRSGWLKCEKCSAARPHNANETECDAVLTVGWGMKGVFPNGVIDPRREVLDIELPRDLRPPCKCLGGVCLMPVQTEGLGYYCRAAVSDQPQQPRTEWFERTQPLVHLNMPNNDNQMNVPGYELLAGVMHRAYDQASKGKGHERHSNGEPFDEQVMADMARRFGVGALLAQAFKKSEESQRLGHDAAIRELLGAINYLAGAVIHMEKNPRRDR